MPSEWLSGANIEKLRNLEGAAGIGRALGIHKNLIARALAYSIHHFFCFDLNKLWRDPDASIRVSPHDLVHGCELLYCIGAMGHLFWRFPWMFTHRKIQSLER